jgi:hypothetical protein
MRRSDGSAPGGGGSAAEPAAHPVAEPGSRRPGEAPGLPATVPPLPSVTRGDATVRAAGALPAPDPVALAALWADQFQHLATLGVAGAGGVLVLFQAELIRFDRGWGLSLALLALTAVLAMVGQLSVVDDATAGRPPGRGARVYRALAIAALGAAAGSAFSAAA